MLLPIGLALHRLSWEKVLRSNLTGMKVCTSVQNICGDILKPSNFYTKVKPPRLLVSGRKNGAAWFSPLRLVLVLVVLCTLIVGFQDIHSFDDDVFNWWVYLVHRRLHQMYGALNQNLKRLV